MDKRNNRVINEIMSNSASSIIILSSSDCENTAFLSELSNRYPTTYWFNAKFDDQFSFSLEIANKVLHDKEIYRKMIQLKYCENDKVDNIIINVVLDNIRKKQGDCLFVFDHLEKLNSDFDYSLIELLIKNSPKNLKLIFISENLINLNYSLLEHYAPKIVDEFALGSSMQSITTDIDVADLTDNDIHFLAYISQISQAPIEFINTIYKRGVHLLKYIGLKYPSLVINKGEEFAISRQLFEIAKNKSSQRGISPYTDNILNLLYNFYKTNKVMNALRLAFILDNLDFINETLNKIFEIEGYMIRLCEFAKCESNTIKEEYISLENIHCYGYSAIYDFESGKYETALKKLEKILALNTLSKSAYIKYSYIKVKTLIELKEYSRGIEFINGIIKDNEEIKEYECLLCFMPILLHDVEQKIDMECMKKCERHISLNSKTDSILHIKTLQFMSEAFFELGNYRKAIMMIQKIKTLVPFYVMPYRLLQYFYYMNDPIYAEKIALNALDKAKEFDIVTDVASIYCLLNKIYSFWGMKEEALLNIEKAVKCENSCPFIKYYAISLRVIYYARFSKKEFAKDIALIYAKQCEQNNNKYAFLIYGSVAYWYWRNGMREEAQFYANKCVVSTNSKTGLWLLATGVALNYALEDDTNEDLKTIVSKFFYTSEQYAMDMVIIDFDDCFINVIKYAQEHNLNHEYVEKLQSFINQKVRKEDKSNKVKIQIMGNVAIYVNNQEIVWKTKKARELFIIYVMRANAGIDRSKIFDLLWNEYIYESAINNLKTTNNIIRNTLTEYGIDFKLNYKNSKYTLTLKNYEFDYAKYEKYLDKFNIENGLGEKVNIMLDIINIYNTGFSNEFISSEFKELGQTVKQNLCLMLIEFIKLLIEKGRIIDAKKFMNSLMRIDDTGKYQDIILKLDKGNVYEN